MRIESPVVSSEIGASGPSISFVTAAERILESSMSQTNVSSMLEETVAVKLASFS